MIVSNTAKFKHVHGFMYTREFIRIISVIIPHYGRKLTRSDMFRTTITLRCNYVHNAMKLNRHNKFEIRSLQWILPQRAAIYSLRWNRVLILFHRYLFR